MNRVSGQPSGDGMVHSKVQVETSPNLPIPSQPGSGVISVLAVSQAGRICQVTVSVDISHPHIADLRASLTTPGGSTVVLQDQSGGNTKNLVRTYTSQDTPALAQLIGEQAQGGWRLRVAALTASSPGTLRWWRLVIACDP
jgi:subtilisin-like proprotein convertase family protein